MFNSVKSVRKQRSGNIRHNADREVPLPLYLGLKMHAETRKRELVDCFFHFIIERFERDGAVCPPQLKEGLFTTGQMDNTDHNPSSTTAVDAFHGTGHSLCQHPTLDNPGTERPNPVLEAVVTEKEIEPLPEAYTTIMPADPMPKVVKPPVVQGPMRHTTKWEHEKRKEYDWLNKQMSV